MLPVVAGAVAGFAATLPMSMAMGYLFPKLPRHEQQEPLPPRKVAMNVAGKAGVAHRMDEEQRQAYTVASHFGYGTAVGAIYGLMAPRIRAPGLVKGVAYGLAVWAGSYEGFLPAAGLHERASRQSGGRRSLMIASHVVWGAALGPLVEFLARSGRKA